jgi:hypothetical protein
MEPLDGIRRIDDGSHFLRIFEIGGQLRPVRFPGFQDLRVFVMKTNLP